MKGTRKTGISRRVFLQRLGVGAGAIGLSPLTRGLIGCGSADSPSPSREEVVGSAEMVGKVTSNSCEVHLVGGKDCHPSANLRIFYDTVSHQGEPHTMNYAYATHKGSGFGHGDPIVFDLGSLSPSTRYFYRVGYEYGDTWVYRDEYSFHTARRTGVSFRFCLAADTHVYPGSAARIRRRVFENVLADRPDFLITLGDDCFVAGQGPIPYPWSSHEVLFKTWQKTRGLLEKACHSTFYLPVNGNHEGLFGWKRHDAVHQTILEGKQRYLPVPDSTTFSAGGDDYGRYGAFTWGDVLVIWLDVVGFCVVDPLQNGNDNADYILGEAQRAFLERTLAGHSSAPWKFIMAHHLFGGQEECEPRYGRGNANAALLHDQRDIQDLMVEYGVQAFFYGHDHVFSVSQADGVSYVCTGHAGSGCPWSRTLEPCYWPYDLYLTEAERIVPAGHVRVDVTPAETRVSYIKASSGADNGSVLSLHVINP